MDSSTLHAPAHLSEILLRYGFEPDNGERESFTQWYKRPAPKDEDTTLCADTYPDGAVKLYSFTVGQQNRWIDNKFDGHVSTALDMARLLWQVRFIRAMDYLEIMKEEEAQKPQ